MKTFLLSMLAPIPVMLAMGILHKATGWDVDFFCGWWSCMAFMLVRDLRDKARTT